MKCSSTSSIQFQIICIALFPIQSLQSSFGILRFYDIVIYCENLIYLTTDYRHKTGSDILWHEFGPIKARHFLANVPAFYNPKTYSQLSLNLYELTYSGRQ